MRAKTVQEIMNESEYDYFDENRELNAAEKRAMAQGKDILTPSQMAACYLNAKNSIGRSEDAQTNFAGKMARKMNKVEKETDFQRVTAPRLADMLNLSVRTVGYTISKFKLLMQGNREGTMSNHLYEKIIFFFDKFEKMQAGEVYSLALQSIDPDADYARSEEFAEQSGEYSKQSQLKKKEAEKTKINMLNDLVSAFVQYKPLGEEKAARQALKSIINKYGTTHSDLIQLIRTNMKEPSLRKIFLAFA